MIGLIPDEATNMVGKPIGLHRLLKKELTDCIFLHYIIYRNILLVWVLPEQFTTILNIMCP